MIYPMVYGVVIVAGACLGLACPGVAVGQDSAPEILSCDIDATELKDVTVSLTRLPPDAVHERAALHQRRGLAFLKRGFLEEAIQDFDHSRAFDATLASNYSYRSKTRVLQGRLKEALGDIESAIRQQPTQPLFILERGDIYFQLGQLSHAIDDFDTVLKSNPNMTDAWLGRGNAYRDSFKYDKALADYQRAIQLSPTSSLGYFNRAVAYHRLDQFDHELVDWNLAIEIDPVLYWLYGIVYRHRHIYNELWSDHQTALTHEPRDAKSFFNRGEAHRYTGQYCRAIRDYSHAIDGTRRFRKAYVGRGIVHLLRNDHANAISDLTQALQRRPDVEAFYFRSRSYAALNQFELALADIAEAFRRSPLNPVVRKLKDDLERRINRRPTSTR